MPGGFMGMINQATGGLFDPRTEGQYAGVDRANFDLPGFDMRDRRDEALAAGYAGRAAPQAADDPFWSGSQRGLANHFQGILNGGSANTMAQQQLRQNNALAMAQQRQLAASAAPGNAAMAQRMAGQNIARITQGQNAQAGMLEAAERNAAAMGLAGLSGQARAQTMQGNQFNAGAQLQQTGLNDAAANSAYNRQLQGAIAQQQGGAQYEANRTNRAAGQLAQPTMGEQILGAGMGAATLALGGPAAAPFASGLMTGQQGGGLTGGDRSGLFQYMAKGGIVTKPTAAIIGEAGPEAVIPLSKLPAIMAGIRNDEELEGPGLMPMARTKQTARGSKGAPMPPPPPPVVVQPVIAPPAPSAQGLYMHYLKGGR